MSISIHAPNTRVAANEVKVSLMVKDPLRLHIRIGGTAIFVSRAEWRDLNNKVIDAVTAHEINQLDKLAEGHYEDA